MEDQKLYRMERNGMGWLEELLTECFVRDPLYCRLTLDEETRTRLMPELMHCDLEEMFATYETFAGSPDIRGMLMVSGRSKPYNIFQYYPTEACTSLKVGECLIRENPSLKTFWNFSLGQDYLNSRWTDQLHQEKRLHIIYLTVEPVMQHHGVSTLLMDGAIAYAREHQLMVSLETYNGKNVAMCQHYGFKIYEVMEEHFDLKQCCLVREVQQKDESCTVGQGHVTDGRRGEESVVKEGKKT